ncbi:hypothetical protein AU510_07700 [Lonsdalea britannica]|nr:hypothetical protein AU510_07700 [Lonsdalea britannica]
MLTDTECCPTKPKEKLYRLNEFNDLHLEVKPNGKKAWLYRFKLNGKIPAQYHLYFHPVILRKNRKLA